MPLTDSYIVYRHTNKADGKVYIGITKQDPERRWQKGAGYAKTYFGNAIAKYGWDGFIHEILYSGLSKSEACGIEKQLIEKYDSRNRLHGYNICEGGQTGDNLNPHYGKDNCRSASVVRIDPASGERKEFQTIKAAVDEMGINHRGISKACRGVSNTYKGYIWEYRDAPFEKPKRPARGRYEHTKQRKSISVIDVDGNEYIFESLNAAASHFGMRANTIGRYVTGVRTDASGRRWSACL